MAAATSPASDVWALFLTALMPVLFGKLPRALERLSKALKQQQGEALKQQQGEAGRQAFLEAVASWKPADSIQLMAIAMTHLEMADLFARGLAADPADRITVQQALQHPALADVVAQWQRVAAAAPGVAKQRAAIRSLAAAVEAEQPMPATPQQLSDCSCSCSSSCDSSTSYGSSVAPYHVDTTTNSSSSSSISHSMQSEATATVAALPTAAQATHAFGCFGGMRWRRWNAAKSPYSAAVRLQAAAAVARVPVLAATLLPCQLTPLLPAAAAVRTEQALWQQSRCSLSRSYCCHQLQPAAAEQQ
jgi:serine/threonine protein kinase